jgi:hypothetical protein
MRGITCDSMSALQAGFACTVALSANVQVAEARLLHVHDNNSVYHDAVREWLHLSGAQMYTVMTVPQLFPLQ